MTRISLPIHMVEKPWGRTHLPAPFAAPMGQRIGEIWFTPPSELDRLLVKYIFTSEKLSVQVHPSDAQTEAMDIGPQGKEECWLVLDAEPGACLGIGFDRNYDEAILRAAALDGRIEHMLRWHPVRPGDFFYIPANTVHAIGAGVSLIEVQQNSDITYRLFDYGRPRELHLDAALAVAKREPYDLARHASLGTSGENLLANGPHFRMARLAGPPSSVLADMFAQMPVYVMPISGSVGMGGSGSAIVPGECVAASDISQLHFSPGGIALIAQHINGTDPLPLPRQIWGIADDVIEAEPVTF